MVNFRPFQACSLQADLIAYLLRVDRAQGLSLAARVLDVRTPSTGCYKALLGDLAKLNYVPELSELAMSRIKQDASPEVSANSALLVSEYGPVSSRSLL